MSEEQPKPKMSPGRQARANRMVLGICAVLFALFAIVLGAYGANQRADYRVRTSPPGGHTTEVVVDEVTTGRYCSSNGKTSNCSDEYTLAYEVDGARHTTPIRKHLHPGDTVHAFKGSDGKWYVTEDPGFGNSKVAWMIWAAFAAASLIFALFCLRGRWKIPKPGLESTDAATTKAP
jgi:hypothetical protein